MLQQDTLKTHRASEQSNLTQDEYKAITTLRKNTEIIIKPADKGGSVVILNKADYIAKANRQLGNTTIYKSITTDQTNKTCKEINSFFLKLPKKNTHYLNINILNISLLKIAEHLSFIYFRKYIKPTTLDAP
jgi:hypothetical protein